MFLNFMKCKCACSVHVAHASPQMCKTQVIFFPCTFNRNSFLAVDLTNLKYCLSITFLVCVVFFEVIDFDINEKQEMQKQTLKFRLISWCFGLVPLRYDVLHVISNVVQVIYTSIMILDHFSLFEMFVWAHVSHELWFLSSAFFTICSKYENEPKIEIWKSDRLQNSSLRFSQCTNIA